MYVCVCVRERVRERVCVKRERESQERERERELRVRERLRQREKPLLCGSAPCHTLFHHILLYDIRLVYYITLHYIIVVPSLGFRV